MNLKKFFNDVDEYHDQKTNEDHGCNGKIKSNVFFLYANIAGQSSKPVQFIVKEINGQAGKNN